MLTEGTGIIYFGFSKCPWCRSLIGTLTEVGIDKNETINYLDILDLRSSFEVTDGSLEKIKEGKTSYYKILDLLDEYLDEYYLTDVDGNKYDTNEKRLYAPTVVAVKDGEVTGFHVGTVESQESGYDKLDEKQLSELKEIIENLFDSIKEDNVCTQEKC